MLNIRALLRSSPGSSHSSCISPHPSQSSGVPLLLSLLWRLGENSFEERVMTESLITSERILLLQPINNIDKMFKCWPMDVIFTYGKLLIQVGFNTSEENKIMVALFVCFMLVVEEQLTWLCSEAHPTKSSQFCSTWIFIIFCMWRPVHIYWVQYCTRYWGARHQIRKAVYIKRATICKGHVVI